MQEVKIFIISPNDVKPERMIVRDICEALNTQAGERLDIVPVLWEDEPFTYTKNPQENIDHLLEESDIYIVILWHRLGSSVEGCTGAITKEKNVTGTQYEIEKILSLGKEHIHFYFKRTEPFFGKDELEEAVEQKRLLEKFLTAMELEKDSTKHGYHEFKSTREFQKQIKKHLVKEIERITSVKIRESPKVIKKKLFYGALIVLLAAVWMMLQKDTMIQTPFATSPIDEKSSTKISLKKRVYVENTKRMDPQIYQALIASLKKRKYVITDKAGSADDMLQIEQKLHQKKSVVSGMDVVRVVCVLHYTLLERKDAKVIDTKSIKEEAVGFDAEYAQRECIEKMIGKIPVLWKE
jgi:hypothetical protein